ncbi:type I restriction-modification system subunit M [Actinomadura violacea]|uniref:site-specific DNA-methyltransferase (adenine-specific) n=1 Tax=Actinomadura violacea TaxID=2819934 RepID=A0ABS3S7S0_9ACTN|nr:class I SAM-dependent DNA methyltransferase [Actinomadura violacea]MBO2465045.1 SAM-dependent DNA methyltransferase [Actinomadura violacea]
MGTVNEQRLTQGELENYLWGAATLLRGLVDAGDYKQFIFPLLFFKRISDVYDEEQAAALALYGEEELAAKPENHRFQIPDGAHWEDVRKTAENVGKAIAEAMTQIESTNSGRLDGVFGDTQWTNKERLPDATLKNLIEHFSSQTLSIARVPEDGLGQAYEFLVKSFADDSGHTAQEFYTNRTLVRLMTLMLKPRPGESIYDPTCGTGGMLVSAVAQLRREGLEHRNVRLCGQERNVMTSAIARMNLFLHGIEDFEIARGDTLGAPAFHTGDRLARFDVILANPPYSIKQWNRAAFAKDKWGRNLWGTPPQPRADYAFFQHIAASLDPVTGRCAILFPHGVLFRNDERALREKLVRSGLLECVLGLGPGLFYNSPMEACVVVLRTNRSAARHDKVLFINAVAEVERARRQTFLSDTNISRIHAAFESFEDQEGFAAVVSTDDIIANNSTLSIPQYVVKSSAGYERADIGELLANWRQTGAVARSSVRRLMTSMEDS